jgi:hypothetical protein
MYDLTIYKYEVPLRPIMSSISSFCIAVAGIVRKILTTLAGKTESFINNSGHFLNS